MLLLFLLALGDFAEAPFFFSDGAIDECGLGLVEVLGAAALPRLRLFERRAYEQRPVVFVQSIPFGDGDVELLPPEQEFAILLNPPLQARPVAQQLFAGKLN